MRQTQPQVTCKPNRQTCEENNLRKKKWLFHCCEEQSPVFQQKSCLPADLCRVKKHPDFQRNLELTWVSLRQRTIYMLYSSTTRYTPSHISNVCISLHSVRTVILKPFFVRQALNSLPYCWPFSCCFKEWLEVTGFRGPARKSSASNSIKQIKHSLTPHVWQYDYMHNFVLKCFVTCSWIPNTHMFTNPCALVLYFR